MTIKYIYWLIEITNSSTITSTRNDNSGIFLICVTTVYWITIGMYMCMYMIYSYTCTFSVRLINIHKQINYFRICLKTFYCYYKLPPFPPPQKCSSSMKLSTPFSWTKPTNITIHVHALHVCHFSRSYKVTNIIRSLKSCILVHCTCTFVCHHDKPN